MNGSMVALRMVKEKLGIFIYLLGSKTGKCVVLNFSRIFSIILFQFYDWGQHFLKTSTIVIGNKSTMYSRCPSCHSSSFIECNMNIKYNLYSRFALQYMAWLYNWPPSASVPLYRDHQSYICDPTLS